MNFGHGLINGGQECLARIDDEVIDFQSRSKGGRRQLSNGPQADDSLLFLMNDGFDTMIG
jgi:hypothetical protein